MKGIVSHRIWDDMLTIVISSNFTEDYKIALSLYKIHFDIDT